MLLSDAYHRLADGPSHARARALRARAGASIATAEADRPSQLPGEEIALGLRLCGSFAVREQPRLLDVIVDLVESTPVGRLGVGVEENAGIHTRRDGHVALHMPDRTSGIIPLGGHQVDHVELTSGTREQACEISKSLRVTEPHCAAFELHRPVVALVAKGVLIPVPKAERGTRLRFHLARGILASLIAACSGVRQPLLRQRR